MLQDVALGQSYSQVRHYTGGGYLQYLLIGSAQISWVAPEDSGGSTPPLQPPVASPLLPGLPTDKRRYWLSTGHADRQTDKQTDGKSDSQ